MQRYSADTFLVAQTVKCLPKMRETRVQPLGRKISWRRKWQPTPVLVPEEFHGQRSLAVYRPWGRKEWDTAEWLALSLSLLSLFDRGCIFSGHSRCHLRILMELLGPKPHTIPTPSSHLVCPRLTWKGRGTEGRRERGEAQEPGYFSWSRIRTALDLQRLCMEVCCVVQGHQSYRGQSL